MLATVVASYNEVGLTSLAPLWKECSSGVEEKANGAANDRDACCDIGGSRYG
jgi:hypothetical protein